MIDSPRPGLTSTAHVRAIDGDAARETSDELATEEPLEIRLLASGQTRSVAVTMRTPGNDFELAAGFLYSEGIIRGPQDIAGITYCIDPGVDEAQRYNIVHVALAPGTPAPQERLERHFTMNSACGVCGKATIEALQTRAEPISDDVRIPFDLVASLPQKMRGAQRVFASTGGLHASALFDRSGEPLILREDVGRHNALDKIVGWALLNAKLPLSGCVVLVSGRASFELLQKSIVARIPIVCAVSAPSSLAVELAKTFDVTLLGFVRERRANIYAGKKRIIEERPKSSAKDR